MYFERHERQLLRFLRNLITDFLPLLRNRRGEKRT